MRALVHRYESGKDRGLGFTIASENEDSASSFVLLGRGIPVGGREGYVLVAGYPEWSDSLRNANPNIDFYRVKTD